jgi:hypothetical protein
MGSREFKFYPNDICDVCGRKGAWDIYGDSRCDKCLRPKKKKKKKLISLEHKHFYYGC